jgi:hypothetical protein
MSASDRGRSMAIGEHDWLRAQLVHRGRATRALVEVLPKGAVTL